MKTARPGIGLRFDWIGMLFACLLTLFIAVPLIVVGTWAFTEVWRYPSVIPQQFGLRFWGQTLADGRCRSGRRQPLEGDGDAGRSASDRNEGRAELHQFFRLPQQ